MHRPAHPGRAGRVARSQGGQTLAFALAFLLTGCVAVYVVFHAFQGTTAKIKLQNTADAAAYSAAVLQARDYNFAAYTNRAMVANQVTVAQAVSLKSWIDDLDNSYTRDWSDLDALINQYADHPEQWNSPKRAGKQQIRPVREAFDALMPTLVTGVDKIIHALSLAQANYHAATFLAVPETADLVARENQGDTHVTGGYFSSARNAAQLAEWQQYTITLDPQQGGIDVRDRFAEVTTDGKTLDGFIKDRTAPRSMPPGYQQIDDSANRACGWSSTASRIVTHTSHKGGTQLRMNLKGWAAIDATTASSRIECVYFNYPRTVSFDMTTGRGGAANGELLRVSGVDSYMVMPVPLPANWKGYGGYYNFSDHRSGVPGRNVLGGIADQFQAGPGKSLDAVHGGLQPYMEVRGSAGSRPGRDLPPNRAPRITIEVERSAASLVKTPGLNGGGRMRVEDRSAGGVMRVLASANAYFLRPDEPGLVGKAAGMLVTPAGWRRDDARIEYPNLFSPYWQATLAPTSDAERQAAIAAQAGEIPDEGKRR